MITGNSKENKSVYEPCSLETMDFRNAIDEANRCLLCEDAPCSKNCPASTDPGRFIRSIRFMNTAGAVETIRNNNVLGASCAAICPTCRLCEDACSRCGIDRPIEIGKLQAFAMEYEKKTGKSYIEKKNTYAGKKVLCIGAGPAGLACAAELAKSGVHVVVADQNTKAGGMLRYGVPPFRLTDDVIDQDVEQVKKLGVEFHMDTAVKPDELQGLRKKYDAVFIGNGLWTGKMLPIKGSKLKGVDTAVNFLKNARESHGKIGKLGKVVIIGGGDVAMDCATTSKTLGADSVTVVFIESLETAPANPDEKNRAFGMGIPLIGQFKPVSIDGDGKVSSITFEHLEQASTLKFAADTVIFAVGQAAGDSFDTSIAGVYAGGDCVNGGKTAVQAVKEGKDAADEIMKTF